MSIIRKRFEKIFQNPKDIKWDELTPVLRFLILNMRSLMEEATGQYIMIVWICILVFQFIITE